MPHISQYKMNHKISGDLNQKLIEFLTDASHRTRRQIFAELLTSTELTMVAKRLGIIYLANKNRSQYEISQTLQVSNSTVARYMLMIENNKLKNTLAWIKRREKMSPLLEHLDILLKIALNPSKYPLSKFLKDY